MVFSRKILIRSHYGMYTEHYLYNIIHTYFTCANYYSFILHTILSTDDYRYNNIANFKIIEQTIGIYNIIGHSFYKCLLNYVYCTSIIYISMHCLK